jgi:DNA-binding transcriptional ArsR family regulator
VDERRLLKALAHPMRLRILRELETRDMASPVECAESWGEPLANVSYHFRRLHTLGFLKIARRTQRRGAIQHHYRVHLRVAPQDDGDLDLEAIRARVGAQAQAVMKDANRALRGGGFDPSPTSLSYARVSLDATGRAQLVRAMHAWHERAQEIAADSAARLEAAERARAAQVVFMTFDMSDVPEQPIALQAAQGSTRRGRAR